MRFAATNMPIITFSSPKMKQDTTVEAVAGDARTLLSVARKHKIPVDFECEEGECGTCAVKVEVLPGSQATGVSLTKREKIVLRLDKKITPAQIVDAEEKGVPPPYRLACQFVVRDENLLVTF